MRYLINDPFAFFNHLVIISAWFKPVSLQFKLFFRRRRIARLAVFINRCCLTTEVLFCLSKVCLCLLNVVFRFRRTYVLFQGTFIFTLKVWLCLPSAGFWFGRT